MSPPLPDNTPSLPWDYGLPEEDPELADVERPCDCGLVICLLCIVCELCIEAPPGPRGCVCDLPDEFYERFRDGEGLRDEDDGWTGAGI